MDDREQDVDDTVVRTRPPRAPVAPVILPGTDLNDTVIRLVDPPRAPRSGRLPVDPATIATPAAASVPPTAWGIRVRGTTTVVPLDVPIVIGRRPGPPRPNELPPPRRVVIPAGHEDVSGRHARIEQLGDSLVVSDLGSTNGVVVHWSTGALLRLRPTESTAVLPDAIVVLGDGVEIEFVAPITSTNP